MCSCRELNFPFHFPAFCSCIKTIISSYRFCYTICMQFTIDRLVLLEHRTILTSAHVVEVRMTQRSTAANRRTGTFTVVTPLRI